MIDVAKLQIERARVEAWRNSNSHKLGTAEFRRSTLVLRLLVDLIKRRGGSVADRDYVACELTAIEQGARDGDVAA